MTVIILLAAGLLPPGPLHAQGPTPAAAEEARALLDQALTLARAIDQPAARADAVGTVAAELARLDPREALTLVSGEMVTHEQSEAMARAAEGLAQDNRLLGLATLIRVGDRSAALVAIGRIIAMEALTDFDEALRLSDKIDTLTVQRMTQREVSRILWDELPGDPQTAIDTAVRWAEAIPDPVTRDEALAYAAQGAARKLGPEEAVEIAGRTSPGGDSRDLAWRLVVTEVSRKDVAVAETLLARIETPFQRSLAAAAVVDGLAAAGRRDDALRLVAQARAAAGQQIEDPRDQGLVLGELVQAVAGLDSATALSVLSEVWPPARRYSLQCRVAVSVAPDDPAEARRLLEDAWVEVRRTDAPLVQDEITAAIVSAAAQVAPDFVDAVTQERPEIVQRALPEAAMTLADQEPDAALALAERLDDPDARDTTKAGLAAALASTRPERARAISDSLAGPGDRCTVLVALARSLLDRGAVD